MIEEKFYPLTASEFEKINNLLTNAELKVYLYLMTLNPFSDRKLEIDTAYLAERLGLNRRTIQRAVKRLEQLELIEIEISKFRYVKKHCKSDETIHSATRRSTRRRDDPPDGSTDRQQRRDDPLDGSTDRQSGSPDRQRPPKPAPSKDSKSSQTIQTYTDFKDSLREDEREKFFNFVEKKIENFNPAIANINDYLASKNRWKDFYKEFTETSTTKEKKTSTKRRNPFKEAIDKRNEELMKEREKNAIDKRNEELMKEREKEAIDKQSEELMKEREKNAIDKRNEELMKEREKEAIE